MSALPALCNLAFRLLTSRNLISISLLPLSVCSVPPVLSCVHLLIRLGHYIWGCWPNQCNKGSLRALLPISVIRLHMKRGLCRVCLITMARRRQASISQVGLLICLLPYEPAGLVGVSHRTGAKRAAALLRNDFISSAAFWFWKVIPCCWGNTLFKKKNRVRSVHFNEQKTKKCKVYGFPDAIETIQHLSPAFSLTIFCLFET